MQLSDLTLCLDEQERGSGRVAHFQRPRGAQVEIEHFTELDPRRQHDGFHALEQQVVVDMPTSLPPNVRT